jgi:hypothetical protein
VIPFEICSIYGSGAKDPDSQTIMNFACSAHYRKMDENPTFIKLKIKASPKQEFYTFSIFSFWRYLFSLA